MISFSGGTPISSDYSKSMRQIERNMRLLYETGLSYGLSGDMLRLVGTLVY